MRPDKSLVYWEGETKELGDGLTLIRCGGHFDGGTVLHWAGGANGRGALLTGDIIQVVPDRKHDGRTNFLGPLTQGPVTGRFIYIDIGRLAGQRGCAWERRLKVPLSGITWEMIQQVLANRKLVLEVHLPGTAKDGGPSCATVHPLEGWKCRRSK